MIKIVRLVVLLIGTMLIFGGCSNIPDKTESDYQTISAEEAKTIMEQDENIIVVDVRTLEEYNEGHIAGAVLIPNETIINEQPEQLPDLDAKILIYCRSGNRSQQAAEKLIELGYTNVYDFGGIIDWPYDTVTE